MRRVAGAAVALLLVLVTPADAYFTLLADGVSTRGRIRLIPVTDPSIDRVVIREGGRFVAAPWLVFARVDPEQGPVNAALVDGPVWKCSRRTRTFTAAGVGAYGKRQTTAFTLRTPSCANRLTLRVRPGRVTVRDSWDLGGVSATLCGGGRCRPVSIPRGRARAARRLPVHRGDRVTLVTRYQRLAQRVGARSSGGATVLTTGDSLMQNLDVVLQDRLAGAAHVVSDIRLGAGLSNEVLAGSWLTIARRQVARSHPRATVVFLGTNDVYAVRRPDGAVVPCCGPDWGAEYERRARAVMTTYAQDGAGSVIWLTVPINRDRRRHPAELAVNAALRRAAATVPGTVIIAADDRFTPGGVYRPQNREPDGIHLSLAGSRIAAGFVLTELRALGVL